MAKIDTNNLNEAEVKSAMETLKASYGWQLLVQFITDSELASLQSRLKTEDFQSLADVKSLQYKVDVIEKLFNYPDTLLAAFEGGSGEEVAEDDEDDPFHQTMDEVRKENLENEAKHQAAE